MQWLSIIFSSLLSGLVGVFISAYYYGRNEKRKWKLQLLQQLLGNRNDIMGDKFTEALNSIFIVYNDSKEVIIALKSFHEVTMGIRTTEQANQKLMDLFKVMCKDLAINQDIITDNFFVQPFNIRK